MREEHQTKEDQKLTATETSLGINVGYKTDSWQHKALVSLDLMQYETVKFYLFKLGAGGGGLFTNKRRNSTGHIVDRVAGADRWVEIKLRKEDHGTGFLIYADGVFFARFKATKPKSR